MVEASDVIDFVSEFTGVDSAKIDLDTTINEDLGVDGDDGYDFLLAFSKKFNVDMSGVDKTYFGGEGIPPTLLVWPLLLVLSWFGWKFKLFEDYPSLPVSALVRSARTKVWANP